MEAGKLTRPINIERETETITQTGSVKKTWSPIATVRAEIMNQSINEFLTGFGEADQAAMVFRIRYRPNILTSDRITYSGKCFNIKEIVEIGRKRGLELRGIAT